MILPLGDTPNPRGVPVVTYALVAANIAVYVFLTLPLSVLPAEPTDPQLDEYVRIVERSLPQRVPFREIARHTSAYDLFVFRHGFRPAAPQLPNLVYALFLHAGFLHLFGNMLFLWIYGDNVEHQLGPLRYLLAYLGTGVAATMFHTAFDRGSPLPLIGASGAISGVLGFYFRWFPRNQVRLLFVFFPFFMNVIMVPARVVLGLFIIADNLLPFLLTRGIESGGVAYGAHIGGFIAGLTVAWLIDRREMLAQPHHERDEGTAAGPTHTAAAAIDAAIADGDFATAARTYFALEPAATRRLLSPANSLVLADWLREHDHAQAALVVYRRHLRDFVRGPGLAEAHLGAGLVQLELLHQPTPAYQHFLAAMDSDPPPHVAARARGALEPIAAQQKFAIRYPRGRDQR